jgi:hypothetical protein
MPIIGDFKNPLVNVGLFLRVRLPNCSQPAEVTLRNHNYGFTGEVLAKCAVFFVAALKMCRSIIGMSCQPQEVQGLDDLTLFHQQNWVHNMVYWYNIKKNGI